MADIFVSYKREDRSFAAKLVAALEAQNWSVWWDTRLAAGEQWDVTIEREIGIARCVVVIWSPNSIDPVRGRWVHTEAHEGLQRRILVPCSIGDVGPPFAFKLIQTPDISQWDGDGSSTVIASVFAAVRATLDGLEFGSRPTNQSNRKFTLAPPEGKFGPFSWGSFFSMGAEPYYEDSLLIWHPRVPPRMMVDQKAQLLTLFIDGMGYDGSGQIASRQAGEQFIAAFLERDQEPTRDRLRAGLFAANSAIALAVSQNPRLQGIGATLLACLLDHSGVQWISVGDIVFYLNREEEIAQISENHSLSPLLDELARSGKITPQQALSDPRRYQLRAALTGHDIDLVDLSHRPLNCEAGDIFILGSASLNALSGEEVARTVTAYRTDGMQAVAHALVRGVEALKIPTQPNLSVIAMQFEG